MIVTAPADILDQQLARCDPTSPEALAVAGELHAVLLATPRAVAVAANQIGSDVRMFAYRDREEGVIVLSNPEIVEYSKRTQVKAEGCLSFPGKAFYVARSTYVKLHAYDIVGDATVVEGHGFQARMFQHEVDHLDGILADARQAGRV